MKVTAENYEALKGFWKAVAGWIHPRLLMMPENTSPFYVLDQFEAKSRSLGRQSLQSGIGDLLEDTQNLGRDQVKEIDARLEDLGLPTLTSVRLIFWKRIHSILDRGRVRSESEYYALRNVVEGMEGETQTKSWALLDDFERNLATKRRKASK